MHSLVAVPTRGPTRGNRVAPKINYRRTAVAPNKQSSSATGTVVCNNSSVKTTQT